MSEHLITAIRVEKLFGLYTYRLPQEDSFSNASILYGDNGVGKSTILRIAFHLLSAANNRSHRTHLFKAHFKKFEVDLASKITLSASRDDKLPNILTLTIVDNGKTIAVWDYQPDDRNNYIEHLEDYSIVYREDGVRKIIKKSRSTKKDELLIPHGESAYMEVLKRHVPTVFILNSDRRLDSDSVSDPSDEMELRKVMRYEEPKRINDLVARSREIALSQAMNLAARWIGKKAIQGANQGSMNVHSVYIDVLRHVVAPVQNPDVKVADMNADLLKKLAFIETKTTELACYELETPLSTGEFKKALSKGGKSKKTLAADLLKPYITSLERRLDALDPIYRVIDKFVSTINKFLNDKYISYKLSRGFVIQNKLDNTLEPAQLSSGEQQLILLFCYVLTGREMPSIFMIDEPEISLNIKWQRQLIQSLLDITEGANVQFIFASHSLELLSQHRNRVVKLVDDYD